MNRFLPAIPTERQRTFLASNALELFYGGAAGGGKTAALLMGALQYVEVPGYSALLLRRTFRELSLPRALIDLSLEWLSPTDAYWSTNEKKWTFPSGATISFGYLDTDRDMWQYQTAAFQYIAFDEVTEFTENQYRFLFSRLRRLEGSILPVRMRSASNPGGRGHEWVKRRFIDSGETVGRVFIPAFLEDNPYLDRVQYEESLKRLDPILFARLRKGDWTVRATDGLFRREWFEIVPESPAEAERVRYWDCASTTEAEADDPDWTIGCRMAQKDGVYYIEDVKRARITPHAVERLVRQTAQLDSLAVRVGMEEEPGSSGKAIIDHYQRNVLRGFAFKGYRSTGTKTIRATPLAIAAEAGNVKLVEGPWVGDFLDELEAAQGHDDQQDAAAGAFEMLQSVSSTVEIW